MMFKNGLGALVCTLLLGTPLYSQDSAWKKEFHAGVMANTGNDIKAFKKGGGWTAGLAFDIPLRGEMSLRPHLTTVVFEGPVGSGLLKDRPHFMAGVDINKPLTENLYAVGGFLCMKWNQTPIPIAMDFKNDGTKSSDLSGIKLGLRAGMGYRFNSTFAAEATWNVVEANQRFVPSWASLGGSVRF